VSIIEIWRPTAAGGPRADALYVRSELLAGVDPEALAEILIIACDAVRVQVYVSGDRLRGADADVTAAVEDGHDPAGRPRWSAETLGLFA
jgi:hypothetical protein